MRDDAYEKELHNIRCGKIIPEEYACKGQGGIGDGRLPPGNKSKFRGTPEGDTGMPFKELSALCNRPSSVLAGTESRTNFLFLRGECEKL